MAEEPMTTKGQHLEAEAMRASARRLLEAADALDPESRLVQEPGPTPVQRAWNACERSDCVPEPDGTATGHRHDGDTVEPETRLELESDLPQMGEPETKSKPGSGLDHMNAHLHGDGSIQYHGRASCANVFQSGCSHSRAYSQAPAARKGRAHNAVPDGRTGPFHRSRHLRMPGNSIMTPYAFDPRCEECRIGKETE